MAAPSGRGSEFRPCSRPWRIEFTRARAPSEAFRGRTESGPKWRHRDVYTDAEVVVADRSKACCCGCRCATAEVQVSAHLALAWARCCLFLGRAQRPRRRSRLVAASIGRALSASPRSSALGPPPRDSHQSPHIEFVVLFEFHSRCDHRAHRKRRPGAPSDGVKESPDLETRIQKDAPVQRDHSALAAGGGRRALCAPVTIAPSARSHRRWPFR